MFIFFNASICSGGVWKIRNLCWQQEHLITASGLGPTGFVGRGIILQSNRISEAQTQLLMLANGGCKVIVFADITFL